MSSLSYLTLDTRENGEKEEEPFWTVKLLHELWFPRAPSTSQVQIVCIFLIGHSLALKYLENIEYIIRLSPDKMTRW
jgi:hypothetical protein